jgi:hypothetical protein
VRFALGLPRWWSSRRRDRTRVIPRLGRGHPERTLPLQLLGVTRRGSDGHCPGDLQVQIHRQSQIRRLFNATTWGHPATRIRFWITNPDFRV